MLCASLAAAFAGTASVVLAVPTCTVASGATILFGAIVALASTPDQVSNSGSSFWVNCTADVTSAPTLYSTSARTMTSGTHVLPFTLSLSASMTPTLPTTGPGTALAIVRDGTNQTVTLYGRVSSSVFRSLPAGVYTSMIFLNLDY
jgi:spore coat protein U-like protein